MEEQALITQRDRPATFRTRAGRLDQTRCFWRHLSTLHLTRAGPLLPASALESEASLLGLVPQPKKPGNLLSPRHQMVWTKAFLRSGFPFPFFFSLHCIFSLKVQIWLKLFHFRCLNIQLFSSETQRDRQKEPESTAPCLSPRQQSLGSRLRGHQGAQSALSPRPEICSLPSSLSYEWNLGREFHFGSEVVLLAFSRNKKQPTVVFLWTISSTLLLVQAACDKCVTNMEPNLCLVFAS